MEEDEPASICRKCKKEPRRQSHILPQALVFSSRLDLPWVLLMGIVCDRMRLGEGRNPLPECNSFRGKSRKFGDTAERQLTGQAPLAWSRMWADK